jgi:hypothetical protein
MHSQLEAIRQQRLHHQSHLVLTRTAIRASLDGELVRLCPLGQLGGQRLILACINDLVCKDDVIRYSRVSCEEATVGGKASSASRATFSLNGASGVLCLTEATSNAILTPATVCHSAVFAVVNLLCSRLLTEERWLVLAGTFRDRAGVQDGFIRDGLIDTLLTCCAGEEVVSLHMARRE